jgi:hypothetical protein
MWFSKLMHAPKAGKSQRVLKELDRQSRRQATTLKNVSGRIVNALKSADVYQKFNIYPLTPDAGKLWQQIIVYRQDAQHQNPATWLVIDIRPGRNGGKPIEVKIGWPTLFADFDMDEKFTEEVILIGKRYIHDRNV